MGERLGTVTNDANHPKRRARGWVNASARYSNLPDWRCHLDLDQLKRLIAEQRLGWEPAETQFSVLSLAEKRSLLGAVPPPDMPSLADREWAAASALHPALAPLPASIDWRSNNGNWITPVENQLQCGSCVAFACVAALEAHVRIARSDPALRVDLSEADLWFCWGQRHGAGRCPDGGWWPDDAMRGLAWGIVDTDCFAYTDQQVQCNPCADHQIRLTRITGWRTFSDPRSMKRFLASSGPLVACFRVYDDFFNYQDDQIYAPVISPQNPEVGGHCVCVVGYDDGNRCWICKNSWGGMFGNAGFFRIRYGVCGIDGEMWAIEGVREVKRVAFQARTTTLSITDGRRQSGTDTMLGMMAGTSPSIAGLRNGSYVIAFQANTSNLWVSDGTPQSGTDTMLGMMAGTSPSIAALLNGRYVIAFQANTSNLWVNDGTPQSGIDTMLGMMAGTSPSIAALPNGRYVIAFQANTSNLWVNDGTPQSGIDTMLGMMAGTSPSIAGLRNGSYVIAFQANTGNLWVNDGTPQSGTDTMLGMMAGTSPSIAVPSRGAVCDRLPSQHW